MDKQKKIDDLFYQVIDPEAALQRCPAMTTMLFKVCSQDNDKFNEAIRIITLFMNAAYDAGEAAHG